MKIFRYARPTRRGRVISLILDSQKEVAQMFDVSIRTVQRWTHQGMPRNIDQTYDYTNVKLWLMRKNYKKWVKHQRKV